MQFIYLSALLAAMLAGHAHAASYRAEGTVRVISSNVAGLPEGISSGNPSANSEQLGARLDGYDLVNVQENFNYDAKLTSQMKTLIYRTGFSGKAGSGDGMRTFSRTPLSDAIRIKWRKASGLFNNGSDELTPKGLSYVRTQLKPGIYLDVYNLHADAATDSGSMKARADNITQLAEYIEANSAGNAVLVMGDTNTRYTREGNVVRQQLITRAGLTDAWISLVRGGAYPSQGDAALTDTSAGLSSSKNEVVDKIFFRSSRALQLTPSQFKVDGGFVDASGKQLTDHYPVSLNLAYAVANDIQFSQPVGGSGGIGFNSLAKSPENIRPLTVTLRGGSRVNAIGITYADSTSALFGGSGGTAKSLTLNSGESLQAATLCVGTKSSPRVFYARLETSAGRTLSAGLATGNCQTFSAPSGWSIGGFFGRASAELDQLGVIFRPKI